MTHHARAQEFLGELAENPPRLPFEPAFLAGLFAGTGEDSMISADQLAEMVSRSQNLAAQVLRLANSAYYGFGSAVSSLSKAIRILGLAEVRNLVIGLGAAAAFKQSALPKGFPVGKTWTHQVLTAVTARELARAAKESVPAMRDVVPDELYTAGLLHDLGKVLVAAKRPEDWLAMVNLAVEKDLPFHLAEEAYWGIDHSVVGARLLVFWEIPTRLTELVGWHHAPALADEEFRPNACLLEAANIIANSVSGSGRLEEELPADARELLPAELTNEILVPRLTALLSDEKSASLAAALVA